MLDEPWTLSPSVALRPEPFGALAYHFGNRKLSFLKRPELVTVVQGLGDHADVRSALHAAGVPEQQHASYVEALRGLAATMPDKLGELRILPLAERAIARVSPGWDKRDPVLPPLLRGGVRLFGVPLSKQLLLVGAAVELR